MEFWQFSGAVAAYIRFKPDRPEVEREIMAHLEDRRDAYIGRGFEREEAERKAVAAMGDPEEIGRALDRLHSPVLGWFQIWFGRAVCLFAIVSILIAFPWAVEKARDFWDYGGKIPSVLNTFWEDYRLWGDEQGHEVVFDIRPDAVWHYGGYTFSIERAAAIRYTEAGDLDLFYIMKAVSPNPWLRWSEFRQWLYAEDDLGNHYLSTGEMEESGTYDYEHESCGNPVKTGPFVSWYELWVDGIDPEASEVTICFDRYGEKAISLTIPMRGGEDRE